MRYVYSLLAVLLLLVVAACSSSERTEDPVAAATPVQTPTPGETATPEPPGELSWEDVVELTEPSTVMVRADFPETAVSFEGQGSGTGIVYSDDGYILTNAHVVSGAAALTVATSGSPRQRSARFVGVSPCDDLAVIQVTDTDGLEVATLGDSSQQRVGGEVAALGYPLGDIRGIDIAFSRGVIGQMNDTQGHYERLIQHDATINPGNSGGPLVNRQGEVVGVNSLLIDPAFGQGMYWAIDINQAKPIVEHLEQGENRLWHGMNLTPNVYPDYFGTDAGLVVAAVASGSSASGIGVQPAFLLTHLEGLSVDSMDDVCRVLRSQSEGSSVSVEFMNVTELGYEFYEGEVVLGDSGGQDLQLVWYETFTGESIEQQQDDMDETTTGEPGIGFNTDVAYQPGEYRGTVKVTFWDYGPCGPDGEWELLGDSDYQEDAHMVLDYPYEETDSNVWFTIFSTYQGTDELASFWIRSSWFYDNGELVNYWDVDFDGVTMQGSLVNHPTESWEDGNYISALVVPDPCVFDFDQFIEEADFWDLVMLSDETFIWGEFSGDRAEIDIWGMTEDFTHDFEMSISVTRVED